MFFHGEGYCCWKCFFSDWKVKHLAVTFPSDRSFQPHTTRWLLFNISQFSCEKTNKHVINYILPRRMTKRCIFTQHLINARTCLHIPPWLHHCFLDLLDVWCAHQDNVVLWFVLAKLSPVLQQASCRCGPILLEVQLDGVGNKCSPLQYKGDTGQWWC